MPPFLDHFSLVSRYYDRLFPVQNAERLRELLRLPAPGPVLDLGGGTGQVSLALGGFEDQVVILDESIGMLRQARLKGLPAVRGEAERLPFAQGSFARILVVDTFHHLRDQRKAAAELLRVLAPGGRLVIEEGNVELTPVRLVALAEKLILMRSRFFSPQSVRAMFEAAGGRVRLHQEGAKFWAVVEASSDAGLVVPRQRAQDERKRL
jgi:ubiquinone/menaquinone biosynthesis C-methylase UbiE